VALPRPPQAGRLDHALYAPRVSWRVPGRHWPQGRGVAACMLIHLEAFEVDPPAGAWRDPGIRGDFGSYFPDYRAHSLVEYGTRIGIFRLLDLLQPLGWCVAVAVNGLVAHTRPTLVHDLQRRGVELLASGWSTSRMHSSALGAEQERAWLAQSTDALAQATGAQPFGYASQDYGYSQETAALLEGLGFDHIVDWPNDEWPFMFGPTRRLLALPPAADLDDAQTILARKVLARPWAQTVQSALLHWAGDAAAGRVFILPLHAWVAGAAHRVPALRRALSTVDVHDFWQAPPSAIAGAWRSAAAPDRDAL
jgi:allantoinase